MGDIAKSFVDYTIGLDKNIEVWTTETGYDLNEKSVQRAIAIGQKSALITQADWILRTSLMYARHGVSRVFFYIAYDIDAPGSSSGDSPFGTSGLLNHGGRRPAADYLLQTRNLMGEYVYENTISQEPLVDIYRYKNKKMYVLVVPDETDRREEYELNLGVNAKMARVYKLKVGAEEMSYEDRPVDKGIIKLTVTETPTFIEAI